MAGRPNIEFPCCALALPTIIAVQRPAPAYDQCFYPALEKLGVHVVNGSFSGRWLDKHLIAGKYVHLQYPSFCYARGPSRFRLLVAFVRFVVLLLLVRMRGAKLLWTAHNLVPHDPTEIPGMDYLGRRIVIALSHRVFAHGTNAAAVIKGKFPQVRGKLVVIEHGNWIDHYPRTRSKLEARDKLGIKPSDYVFLFIGMCKEYKNVHGLIRTFSELSSESLLLIAGKFQSADYRHTIFALADGNARIKIYPYYIADEDLQDFLCACDCVVLPYQEILTSGAAMLALSFGRPVVSIRCGSLQDVVTEEVGVLFDPADPDGLAQALIEVRKRYFDEQRILAHARRFSWENSAQVFIKALDCEARQR
jgi:beta-1,4-mannosyltransferase